MSEQSDFDATASMASTPDASGDILLQSSRRSSEREVVSYLGIVVVKDQDLKQVNLVDLSAEGARMVADESFNPDGEFVLKVPETGASFVSEVVWKTDATFGIRFLRPGKD